MKKCIAYCGMTSTVSISPGKTSKASVEENFAMSASY
jgi:hypothetical protein